MIGQPIPPSVIADPRRLQYVRHVAASPAQVYAAFTDPDALATWWGPNGFRTTTHEMDVRPGGVWRHTMHGPDGTDYPNYTVYREVVPPERLVYDNASEQHAPDTFRATITFDEVSGSRTRVTLRMVVATPEQLEEMKKFGAVEGGQQTLARLAEYLESSKSSKPSTPT